MNWLLRLYGITRVTCTRLNIKDLLLKSKDSRRRRPLQLRRRLFNLEFALSNQNLGPHRRLKYYI